VPHLKLAPDVMEKNTAMLDVQEYQEEIHQYILELQVTMGTFLNIGQIIKFISCKFFLKKTKPLLGNG